MKSDGIITRFHAGRCPSGRPLLDGAYNASAEVDALVPAPLYVGRGSRRRLDQWSAGGNLHLRDVAERTDEVGIASLSWLYWRADHTI